MEKRYVVGLVLLAGLPLAVLACSASGGAKGQTTSGDTGGASAGSGSGSGGATASSTGSNPITSSGNGGLGVTSGSGGSVPTMCTNANDKSSSGCDYYALDPDITFDATGGCYAAYVVNPQKFDVMVSMDFKGMSYDPSTFGYIPKGTGPSITYTPIKSATIPAGQIAILFLNRFGFSPPGLDTDCPAGVTPAISTSDAAPHGTTMGNAFHIQTTAPVVAYDIYPYGGGQSAMTSATLLLPTTSWGDNYIAVSAFGEGLPIGNQPFLSIVGQQDGTMVTINPTKNIVAANGVQGATAGMPTTYQVDKGQVLQFTQGDTLEGSIIQSTVPVGVWGGETALSIEACCDDSAHQQIPPVRALGNEYALVRYRNRYDGMEETPPWRFVGAVDGTMLTWEPSTPPGAPTSLNLGQVAQFDGNGPYVVRSQDMMHPFYVSAHMTGAAMYDPSQTNPNSNAPADGRGDAEFVNVIPPGEYMNKYTFFTDPTYPETNLVLVRVKNLGTFADVTLDCAGALTGWQPLGTSGNYEYTRFDLSRHNFQGQGSCDNGTHTISSDNPFGLTVWGWGSAETGEQFMGFYTQYVSYAYPGGASVAPINNVTVPPNIK